MPAYKLTNSNIIIKGNMQFPADPTNSDYQDYLRWLEAGNTPDPADPLPPPDVEPEHIEFNKPIIAPDFIVATPPIDPDPEKALLQAIAEIEKGKGNPKSLYIIAAGLAKWIKANKEKIDKLK